MQAAECSCNKEIRLWDASARLLTHLLIFGQALLGLGELIALSLLRHGLIIVGSHVE